MGRISSFTFRATTPAAFTTAICGNGSSQSLPGRVRKHPSMGLVRRQERDGSGGEVARLMATRRGEKEEKAEDPIRHAT